jgi:hypothetical protein
MTSSVKKTTLISLFIAFVFAMNAQIATNERPYGLTVDRKEVSYHTIGKELLPDMQKVEAEDRINDRKETTPLRFACPVKISFTLEDAGSWQELPNGDKVWTLDLAFPGALSTHALYDEFWLPEGAKFSVFSRETGQYIGAITSEFIEGSAEAPAKFATGLIYGEHVSFEYYQPSWVTESARISISRIDYGYRYINDPYRGYGDSGACEVNVNCPEGNNWQSEKNAVARILEVFPNGSGWCSCALMNNTNQDGSPYVLTADHCLNGVFDAVTNPDLSQWIFYWQYEYAGCTGSSEPTLRSTVGATVVANSPNSDFSLLRLTQNPNFLLNVPLYYLGWDRSGSPGTGGVGIHHPRGDVKKISTYTMTPQSTSYLDNVVNPNADHWRLTWVQTNTNHGVTEGGSSGSPLINTDRKVIGQLHGGYASCNLLTSPDWYGKFSVSWTGNGATDSRRRLRDWLDPFNQNPTTLSGRGSASTVTLVGYIQQSSCGGKPSINLPLNVGGINYVNPGGCDVTVRMTSNATNLTCSVNYPQYPYSFYKQGGLWYLVFSIQPNTSTPRVFYIDADGTTLQLPFFLFSNYDLTYDSDLINLTFHEDGAYTVSLYDISGNQVKSSPFKGAQTAQIGISNLSGGVYILIITDDKGNKVGEEKIAISR